jgi:hypothetical protein
MLPGDCGLDQDFTLCESEAPAGVNNYGIGFVICSFTRFAWAIAGPEDQ